MRSWIVPFLAAAALVGVLLPIASASAPEPPFTSEPVARGALDDTRNVVVAKITLQPGGYVDWHTHPGLTLGVVTGGGTLTIVKDGCRHLTYPTGTAFTAPRDAHTARNFSEQTLTVVATFRIKGPMPTIFVSPERDAQLDARCGLEE
jgi:quercetin dioxygenase-like cupin family protein